MTKRDELDDQGHISVEAFVHEGLVVLGPLGEMDRLGRGGIGAADQVLMKLVGEERHGRRDQLAERDQRRVERAVGGLLVGVRAGLPEAAARAAQVPGGHLLDEGLDGARGAGDIVGLVGGRHVTHEDLQLREQPAVQDVGAVRRGW